MKAVGLALALGAFLNMSTFEGRSWPLGTVAAVIIMGVWIKTSMDKHFEELKEQMKQDGESRNEKKEDR